MQAFAAIANCLCQGRLGFDSDERSMGMVLAKLNHCARIVGSSLANDKDDRRLTNMYAEAMPVIIAFVEPMRQS